METDALIASLAEDTRPVKPAMKPLRALVGWLGLMLVYVVVTMLVLGAREDLDFALERSDFILELFLSALTMFSAAFVASRNAYPDLAQDKKLIWLALVPAGGFLLLVASQVAKAVTANHFSFNDGMECSMSLCSLTLIPAGILYFLLARGFFIDARMASFSAALAATMTGYVSLRLVEPTDNISHLFIWHLVPFILLTAALTQFGKRFFRKRS